ncbi:hypothetical protein [Bartonella sp. HY761]|uniref:hypothetical protein n=1 Tax=Bartonella sp. HY761 TaxID=2979330 RepID=UPI002207E493|nr:hypothetical protein [Bartonella sp. HY761]UXN07955.1 hypothetical protein N6A79_15220 [Bartonella sp. HY761]
MQKLDKFVTLDQTEIYALIMLIRHVKFLDKSDGSIPFCSSDIINSILAKLLENHHASDQLTKMYETLDEATELNLINKLNAYIIDFPEIGDNIETVYEKFLYPYKNIKKIKEKNVTLIDYVF